MKEVIFDVLMVTRWIMGEIWVLLVPTNNLKIARLLFQNYFYFYIVEDAMLNYQPAKFVYNCDTHYRDMDKIDKSLLTGGRKSAFSQSLGFHWQLIL